MSENVENLPVVDLTVMTLKQRQKEFKSTQKDLKSKDSKVKLMAVKKLWDLTYIREGGCLPVFLQTLHPKKKTLDYTHAALTFLSDLLHSIRLENSENAFWIGLDALISDGADLQVIFSGVLECISIQDIKPLSKKPKKNEPPHVENPSMVLVRSMALKVLYLMMVPLLTTPSNNRFRLSLSKIQGLGTSLLDALQSNMIEIAHEDPLQSTQSLQNVIYAINLLVFIMRSNTDTVAEFIVHPIISSLSLMTKHPLLSVPLCQLLTLASLNDDGIKFLSDSKIIELLLDVLEYSKNRVVEIAAPPVDVAPPGKGKEVKKDDKGKKNVAVASLETVTDPYAQYDYIRISDLRKYLVQLHLITRILIRLSVKHPPAFDEYHVLTIAASSKEYLSMEKVWEDVCSVQAEPMDEPLRDFLWQSVGLLGRLGDISSSYCTALRKQGIMPLVLSLLIKSSDVYYTKDNGAPYAMENSTCLWLFKRHCEKTVFSLLGCLRETVITKSRFLSCEHYILSPDEFNSFGELVDMFNTLLQSNDLDVAVRGVRIIVALLTAVGFKDNPTILDAQQSKSLLSSLCNVCSKLLKIIVDGSDFVARLDVHVSDPLLYNSLYLTIAAIEHLISSDAECVKLCFDKERIAMIVQCIELFGPLNGKIQTEELQVVMFDPRLFNWEMEKSEKYFDQIYYMRPLLIDFIRHIVQSDTKYRVYEAATSSEMEIQPSLSPVEEQCHLTVKISIDVVIRIIGGAVDWDINDLGELIVGSNRRNVPVDDVVFSVLLYLQAVGSVGPVVLLGCIDEIAARGFSSNWEQSALQPLLFMMNKLGYSHVVDSNPYNRCLTFSDFISDNSTIPISVDILKSIPKIWPYFAMMGPLVSLISCRDTSALILKECLSALFSLIRFGKLEPSLQPVVMDILCTTMVLLGGLVQILSLFGRFSKLEDRGHVEEILSYILARGHVREQFWKKWEVDHRVQVQLDPKTGKPIAKKDDKDKKVPTKDKKADKNTVVVVPVFPEIQLNTESTEVYPDPNRGPTCALWTRLLNQCFACSHICSPHISVLACGIIGGSSEYLFSALENYVNIDINVIDFYGRTPLMYSLLLNDVYSVNKLLSRKADLNVVDANCVPTVMYALSTLNSEILQNSLCGFCQSPSNELKIVRGHSYFLESLLKTRNVDTNVADSKGCNPLLYAMGEGFFDVGIGGYYFRVFNMAYEASSNDPQRENNVKLLIHNGCNVNHAAKNGKVPLHIACSQGDFPLVHLLLESNADPNLLDIHRWHSLHYIMASCPVEILTILDMIVLNGKMHPLQSSVFADYRTGASEEKKFSHELQQYFDECITEALLPLSLSAPRANIVDLLTMSTEEMYTPFLLCCVGSSIKLRDDTYVAEDSSVHERRVTAALHLVTIAQEANSLFEVLQDSPHCTLKLVHGLSMLLRGVTKKSFLSEKQKRSKRIRYHESKEAEILSIIIENLRSVLILPESPCNINAPVLEPYNTSWTPFHAIIYTGSIYVLENFIKLFEVQPLITIQPILFMAQLKHPVKFDMACRIIEICSSLEDWSLHFNGNSECSDYPIHWAINNRQYELLTALAACPKVDLNLPSKKTGLTPIQAACVVKDLHMINSLKNGCSRLDFTLPLPTQFSSISLLEYLIDSHDFLSIQQLTDMRKTDVLEMLLTENEEGTSLLKKLKMSHVGVDREKHLSNYQPGINNTNEISNKILSFFFRILESTGFDVEMDTGGVDT